MQKICLIKTSVNSLQEAEELAANLVKTHLAACIQISGPGKSVYHWQGKLEMEEEYYLSIKTAPALRETAIAQLARSHPYEVPEIIWSEFDTTGDYGSWVYSEVGASLAATDTQE
ncbi:divalent cation tolerance protein [Mariprofundus aestuarium]|uniref:Divalent cation tolerance protein n=1 Tax=Mariprofundus aestuarium TaxID=1921086 RepID=A0A2K8L0D6_MARES|nr:divalent-cation tolerance protein CutA [Mariprofundus aestuarium]ATX80765.1 divalent cation tolerance protein [Mariprofundus aestuarium]